MTNADVIEALQSIQVYVQSCDDFSSSQEGEYTRELLCDLLDEFYSRE